MDTVENPDQTPGLRKLMYEALDQPHQIRKLREDIVELLTGECNIYEVWIDLPRTPISLEPAEAIIQNQGGDELTLADYFPTENWLGTYASKKWRGHIFCPADDSIRKKVANAAMEVLEQPPYKIKFKPSAWIEAKNPL